MPQLVWDAIGTRNYETGIQKGVLYLPETHIGIPWNGLVSVEEAYSDESNPFFYNNSVRMSSFSNEPFSGSLSVFTFPDEFLAFCGFDELDDGFFATEQPTKLFNLSYQTKIGNDLTVDAGYKIHILYGLSAVPTDIQYQSGGDSLAPVTFKWDLNGSLIQINGYKPTGHVVIDSRYIDPDLLIDLECILYGTEDGDDPVLPEISFFLDFIAGIRSDAAIVVDNGDGTWTATVPDEQLHMIDSTTFEIYNVRVVYLDKDTYRWFRRPVGAVTITDNGDGTWTATGSAGSIQMTSSTSFVILGGHVDWIDSDTFEISSTS